MFRGKNKTVIFRLSAREREELEKQAQKYHLTMSEYIRRVILSPPPVTRKEYENVSYHLLYELRKIGVNINQIAKKYNEHRYIEPRKELLDKMDRIDGLTKEIIEFLTKEGG